MDSAGKLLVRNTKIRTIDDLARVVAESKARLQKVVHCHGVFDLLHIGHIKHLEAARQLGDLLVVTLTPDRFVNKGPHRPAFPERLRAEAMASLVCVDYVAINEWPTAVETIHAIKPSLFVKGLVRGEGKRDHTDAIQKEEEAVQAVGGALVLTDEDTYSASELINRYMDVFPVEVRRFLEDFRKRHSPEEIVGYLQAIRKMRVLVIGETIIDDYQFCDVIGKAGKEPVLVARYKHGEQYAGGILAVANHVANFCDHVGLVSALGTVDSREEFIRSKLRKNIEPYFLRMTGSPTIVKRRFLEEYLSAKLFEVYLMQGEHLDPALERECLDHLDRIIPDYDVVIVADFGHGLLTKSIRQLVRDRARFLAVNTQTNAGNRGFNMISKYPHADFVSIGEPEVRLECRDMTGNIDEMSLAIAQRMGLKSMLVTRGRSGILCYNGTGFQSVPAFSFRVVDRVGAGDAVLAVTSPCVARGTPSEAVGFIANVVGAEACMIMGNKTSIEPSSLFRHITSLMK